jgi:trans-aconitate methyltransferase
MIRFSFFHTNDRQKWDTERYQKQHSFVWKYGASLLEDLFKNNDTNTKLLKPGDCILDVGCGSGELTAELYQRARQEITNNSNGDTSLTTSLQQPTITVMGMDASADMIAAASKQYPHVTFFQGDVRDFVLPNTSQADHEHTGKSEFGNQVNVIFSNAALHWIPPSDVDRAVAAMSRILVPGGRLVVEFGGKGNAAKITQAARHVLAQQQQQQQQQEHSNRDMTTCQQEDDDDDFHGWYFPSISEFTTILEKHGIEVTSATIFDRPTPLEDGIHGMSNWLRMFGSRLLSVPAATQQQQQQQPEELEQHDREQVLIRQIHDELLRRGELWNGEQWIADYRRIRVMGKKK